MAGEDIKNQMIDDCVDAFEKAGIDAEKLTALREGLNSVWGQDEDRVYNELTVHVQSCFPKDAQGSEYQKAQIAALRIGAAHGVVAAVAELREKKYPVPDLIEKISAPDENLMEEYIAAFTNAGGQNIDGLREELNNVWGDDQKVIALMKKNNTAVYNQAMKGQTEVPSNVQKLFDMMTQVGAAHGSTKAQGVLGKTSAQETTDVLETDQAATLENFVEAYQVATEMKDKDRAEFQQELMIMSGYGLNGLNQFLGKKVDLVYKDKGIPENRRNALALAEARLAASFGDKGAAAFLARKKQEGLAPTAAMPAVEDAREEPEKEKLKVLEAEDFIGAEEDKKPSKKREYWGENLDDPDNPHALDADGNYIDENGEVIPDPAIAAKEQQKKLDDGTLTEPEEGDEDAAKKKYAWLDDYGHPDDIAAPAARDEIMGSHAGRLLNDVLSGFPRAEELKGHLNFSKGKKKDGNTRLILKCSGPFGSTIEWNKYTRKDGATHTNIGLRSWRPPMSWASVVGVRPRINQQRADALVAIYRAMGVKAISPDCESVKEENKIWYAGMLQNMRAIKEAYVENRDPNRDPDRKKKVPFVMDVSHMPSRKSVQWKKFVKVDLPNAGFSQVEMLKFKRKFEIPLTEKERKWVIGMQKRRKAAGVVAPNAAPGNAPSPTMQPQPGAAPSVQNADNGAKVDFSAASPRPASPGAAPSADTSPKQEPTAPSASV